MTRYLMLLAAVLTACGDSTAPEVHGDLAIQRALWEGRGITSYDYDFTHWSEWYSSRTDRVSVRNGVVTKIVNAAGDSIGPSAPGHGITIDDLFERAAQVLATADSTDDLSYELGFDPGLNYVRRLEADRAKWADDAYGYAAANLVRR